MRVADGKRGNWTRATATADDFDEADGNAVLDFWQAQEKARGLARESNGTRPVEPVSLGQALDRYAADLKTRGGDLGNVAPR
jgi:hypothetical protein